MGDDASPMASSDGEGDWPDFSGKVVVCYLAHAPGDTENGVVLEYAQFRRYQGRWFLAGRVPEYVSYRWASRLQQAVAWDTVIHYMVFDSREDYQRRLGQAQPSLAKRLLGLGR